MEAEPIVVKFKRLNEKAVIPTKAHETDAGFDITATAISVEREDGVYIEYGTGLEFEIPEGYAGFLFPRSSISKKNVEFSLRNAVGVIDSSYRGEVTARFSVPSRGKGVYAPGDRILQMIIMPIPEVQFVESKELTDTERGKGGYGSSGD